jgi:hypothetical protein
MIFFSLPDLPSTIKKMSDRRPLGSNVGPRNKSSVTSNSDFSARSSLNASAARRMNGSWTPQDQLAKTRANLQQTTDSMLDYKAQSTNNLARGMNRHPTHRASKSIAAGNNPTFDGPLSNPNNNTFTPSVPRTPATSFSPYQGTPYEGTPAPNLTEELKQQLSALKNSMKSMNISGMTPPAYTPHPNLFSSNNNGNKSTPSSNANQLSSLLTTPANIQAFANRSKDASTAAAASGTTSTTTNATATDIASQLTSTAAVNALTQLQQVMATVPSISLAAQSVGAQLNSLRSDDRFPTDFHFGLSWNMGFDYDSYNKFKELYYNKCWNDAKAQVIWLSNKDATVGQVIQSTNAAGVVTKKAIPFEVREMVFDEPQNILYVAGTRNISSTSNNGTMMWEPVLLAFTVDPSTTALTLSTNWLSAITSSFAPILANWMGEGMCINDVKLNVSDGTLFVLLNLLASSTSPASFLLIHVLANGSFDTQFDYTQVPRYYGKTAVVCQRMAHSIIQSNLYVLSYVPDTDSEILVVNAVNGMVQGKLTFDQTVFLRDITFNDEETQMSVVGFEMTAIETKSSTGLVYSFDITTPLPTEVKSFGESGSTSLSIIPTVTKSNVSSLKRFTNARAQRCILISSQELLVVGDVLEGQFQDNAALSLWWVDATSGDITSQLVFKNVNFPKSSLVIDNILWDSKNQLLSIIGLIRHISLQANSSEIWIAQVNLLNNVNTVQSFHLPATPDLYAHGRSLLSIGNEIVFGANMQSTKFSWGRHALLALIPQIFPVTLNATPAVSSNVSSVNVSNPPPAISS